MKTFKGRTATSKDDWATPQYFFDLLDREFHFTLDPCASAENHKCPKYYTLEQNGLEQSWKGETVFVNPPFNHKDEWIEKCWKETKDLVSKPTIVVLIIPSTTDTKAWHKYIMDAHEIRFCKGRVNFIGSTSGATFPLSVIVFKNQPLSETKVSSFEHKSFEIKESK
jgi:phage N-6-adenine-methyltransferase